jgi:hypothetical protein
MLLLFWQHATAHSVLARCHINPCVLLRMLLLCWQDAAARTVLTRRVLQRMLLLCWMCCILQGMLLLCWPFYSGRCLAQNRQQQWLVAPELVLQSGAVRGLQQSQ